MKTCFIALFCFFATQWNGTAQSTVNIADLLNGSVTTTDLNTKGNLFNGSKEVIIPIGTEIIFETQNEIDMMRISEGQTILFLVAEDVVVDGRVIVATNSRANGVITFIEPATSSSPAKIAIRVKSVTAVNGERIFLNGSESIMTAPVAGMSHRIRPGTLVRAHTLNRREMSIAKQ